MTCKLQEIMNDILVCENEKRKNDEFFAIKLVEKLERDCSCMEFKTTKINRNWKNLWFGSFETIKTAPTFKIKNNAKDEVVCTFGDLKIVIECDSSKNNGIEFYSNVAFGPKKFPNYKELLNDLSRRLHSYSKVFEPGETCWGWRIL